jgi:hypothetical protein
MLIALIVVSWIALMLLVLLFLGGGKRAELEQNLAALDSQLVKKNKTILFQEKTLDEAERTAASRGAKIKRRDVTLVKVRSELKGAKASVKQLTSDLEGAASRHEQAIQLFEGHRCKDHRYGKDDMFYLVNDPTETPRKVVAFTVTKKEGTFYSYQDGKTKRTIHQRSMRKIEPKETEYPLDKPAHKKEGE